PTNLHTHVTATRSLSTGRTWILRIAIETGISSFVVSLFTATLGIAFWAFDPDRLPCYVSVLQSFSLGNVANAPSAITLFWTMDQTGTTGRQLHLAIHSLDTTSSSRLLGGANFKPNAIAAAPDKDHVLVGTWDGEI